MAASHHVIAQISEMPVNKLQMRRHVRCFASKMHLRFSDHCKKRGNKLYKQVHTNKNRKKNQLKNESDICW